MKLNKIFGFWLALASYGALEAAVIKFKVDPTGEELGTMPCSLHTKNHHVIAEVEGLVASKGGRVRKIYRKSGPSVTLSLLDNKEHFVGCSTNDVVVYVELAPVGQHTAYITRANGSQRGILFKPGSTSWKDFIQDITVVAGPEGKAITPGELFSSINISVSFDGNLLTGVDLKKLYNNSKINDFIAPSMPEDALSLVLRAIEDTPSLPNIAKLDNYVVFDVKTPSSEMLAMKVKAKLDLLASFGPSEATGVGAGAGAGAGSAGAGDTLEVGAVVVPSVDQTIADKYHQYRENIEIRPDMTVLEVIEQIKSVNIERCKKYHEQPGIFVKENHSEMDQTAESECDGSAENLQRIEDIMSLAVDLDNGLQIVLRYYQRGEKITSVVPDLLRIRYVAVIKSSQVYRSQAEVDDKYGFSVPIEFNTKKTHYKILISRKDNFNTIFHKAYRYMIYEMSDETSGETQGKIVLEVVYKDGRPNVYKRFWQRDEPLDDVDQIKSVNFSVSGAVYRSEEDFKAYKEVRDFMGIKTKEIDFNNVFATELLLLKLGYDYANLQKFLLKDKQDILNARYS